MKKILIGIGIFLVFSFILGLIINSVDNSANKPNPYKSSYRTAFVNGCASAEECPLVTLQTKRLD